MKTSYFYPALFLVLAAACQAQTYLPETDQPASSFSPTSSITSNASEIPAATTVPPVAENWIAFTHKNNLWLIHPDGSGLTQITENTLPKDSRSSSIIYYEWSPDGNFLA